MSMPSSRCAKVNPAVCDDGVLRETSSLGGEGVPELEQIPLLDELWYEDAVGLPSAIDKGESDRSELKCHIKN